MDQAYATTSPPQAMAGHTNPRRKRSRAAMIALIAELPDEAHLNENEAAAYLGTTSEALRIWRHQQRGPKYKGNGNFIRYMKGHLKEFLA